MPSAREIRVRMNSIQQTRKITNAMYLISSAKLRKAKQEWDQTRPYFQALKAEVKRIFRTSGHVESRYLYPDEGELPPDGTYGFLVITADKGLAGAYNQNVLKEAHRLMQKHPQTKLFVVGEYGRQYFQRHQVPIERSFLYTAQNPTMQRAREITAELLDRFDKGELQKIFVIYTDMKNSLTENVTATEAGGMNSHAAIAGKALLKPTIVGAVGATAHIRDGLMVAVDCAHGSVQRLQA